MTGWDVFAFLMGGLFGALLASVTAAAPFLQSLILGAAFIVSLSYAVICIFRLFMTRLPRR